MGQVVSGAASTIILGEPNEISFALWTGIIAGIIAGIATAGFLWLGKVFIINWVKPKLSNMLYRDAKIEGRWKGDFSKAALDGHRLDEFVTRVRNNERHRTIRMFKEMAEAAAKDNSEIELNPVTNKKANNKKNKTTKNETSEAKAPTNVFSITIKRNGHIVNGHMLGINGDNEGRHYQFNGTFKNLTLTATYESTDQSELERGTITLMLKHNGQCMYGYIVALDDEDHDLGAARMVWRRN